MRTPNKRLSCNIVDVISYLPIGRSQTNPMPANKRAYLQNRKTRSLHPETALTRHMDIHSSPLCPSSTCPSPKSSLLNHILGRNSETSHRMFVNEITFFAVCISLLSLILPSKTTRIHLSSGCLIGFVSVETIHTGLF